MTSIDTESLVNRSIIAEWEAQNQAAATWRTKAASDLAAAQAEHVKAKRVAQLAIEGNGDPVKADDALSVAEKRLRLFEKVANAAEAALAKSNQRKGLVRGLAHKGIYEGAIKLRVAAARAGDAARAALAAAERDYAAATGLMNFARQNGCSDIFGVLDGLGVMKTENDERKVWTSRNIDPDMPVHSWQPE